MLAGSPFSSNAQADSIQASGNIGVPLVFNLLTAGFAVTALTRPNSKASFPSGVRVVPVDYASVPDLVEALKGHQAVVSVVGISALDFDKNLVEAAAAAGVKRFIPAEYGADLSNPRNRGLFLHASKVEVEELLVQKSKEQGMTYTFIYTGPFLDWGLSTGFILDVRNHRGTLYDEGKHFFSATTTKSIAKAIAGCLEHPKETENRAVYIQDVATTQEKLLEIAQRLDPHQKWEISHASTTELEKTGAAAIERGDLDMSHHMGTIFVAHFGGEKSGEPFKKLDNELLGVKGLSDPELEELVREIIQGN